ncbi:MAG: hypothetical protein OEV22_17885 [Deltaproteobacteria bacterium]|nr:hypothetical protein [Deltaproteobacteria bacterium]
MAGIKISNLPAATTPLAGTESIPVVQSTCTKQATISDIADVVSGDFVTNSEYASTSGAWTTVNSFSANWDGVYSSYQSASASFVNTYEPNTFTCIQTFTDVRTQHLEAGFCVTADGACASVLGGYYNDATGSGSAVVAGNNNDTFGNFSTIAGGQNNCITAAGINGFIAGGGENVVSHAGAVAMGTCTESVSADMLHVTRLYAKLLPTSDPGVTGVVWNDAGTLKISV